MTRLQSRSDDMVNLNDLAGVGLAFVLIGVVLAVGAYINTSIQTTAGWSTGSTASNAVGNATSGIGQLASWLPIIAIVIAAGAVITVLVGSFKLGV